MQVLLQSTYNQRKVIFPLEVLDRPLEKLEYPSIILEALNFGSYKTTYLVR